MPSLLQLGLVVSVVFPLVFLVLALSQVNGVVRGTRTAWAVQRPALLGLASTAIGAGIIMLGLPQNILFQATAAALFLFGIGVVVLAQR